MRVMYNGAIQLDFPQLSFDLLLRRRRFDIFS